MAEAVSVATLRNGWAPRAVLMALAAITAAAVSLGIVTGASAQQSVPGTLTTANGVCAISIAQDQQSANLGSWIWDGNFGPGSQYTIAEEDGNVATVSIVVYGESSASDDVCYLSVTTTGLFHQDSYPYTVPGFTHITSESFIIEGDGTVLEGDHDITVTLASVVGTLAPGTYTGTLEFTVSNPELE